MQSSDLIYSGLFKQHGLIGVFTRRTGGVSPAPFDSLNFGFDLGDDAKNISSNIESLMLCTGIHILPHQAKQVHGTHVLHCSGRGVVHSENADALITSQAETPLAVRTADCLPILLADPVSGVTAAVHAGWRGTAANIVRTAVDEMGRLGALPESILASLGPCIGPCCFDIGEQTAADLSDSAPGAGHFVSRPPRLTADIAGINTLQLKESGLTEDHIERHNVCSTCNADSFFSFRRDHGNTGRHLAVVARLPNT